MGEVAGEHYHTFVGHLPREIREGEGDVFVGSNVGKNITFDSKVKCHPEYASHHNICIGYKSGYELTTQHHTICLGVDANPKEDYEFVFSLCGFDSIRTIMTLEEWKVVSQVIMRASKLEE